MSKCKFKVGDKVVLNSNWDGSDFESRKNDIFTISEVTENFYYGRGERITTKISFINENIWAEPHEIERITKLEKVLYGE